MTSASGTIGVVVIGRNEARRLEPCLDALRPWWPELIYVDSGSTDDSPKCADSRGIHVLRLASPPYSAARGRQAGLDELLKSRPNLRYVQFVDGDCILDRNWMDCAVRFLDGHSTAAVVAGRLRERYAKESLLIRLVDVDWDLPIGEIDAVGGIFLARVETLHAVGGWRTDLVAGEELDLSARLRAAGWSLHRLPDEMTLHDIGIRNIGELWRRSVRSGFSYAELAAGHGWTRCRRWLRRAVSNVLYGVALPLTFLIFLFLYWPVSVGVLAVYALLVLRVTAQRRRHGDSFGFALLYATTLTAFKSAAAIGTLKWLVGRTLRRPRTLIEYKSDGLASRG